MKLVKFIALEILRCMVHSSILIIFLSLSLSLSLSPLPSSLFSGVYGTDDYQLTDPVVLLLLPSLPIFQKMESLFSSHLISVIREHVSKSVPSNNNCVSWILFRA